MHLQKSDIHTSYIYPTHDRLTYVRKIAHGLKNGNEDAIRKAACGMAIKVESGSVLVPIHSPRGYADATLKLALAISEKTNEKIHVADILFSAPRVSHYLSKKRGIALTIEAMAARRALTIEDRKSTRLNSSHVSISYAVFCLKK